MKKVMAIILTFVMCLSLCACGKSKNATECEQLINAIGEVSVDSGEAIEVAEKAYNILSEKEKDSISESANRLTEYREEYIFTLSKAAYNNIDKAYAITELFCSDLYEAWRLGSQEGPRVVNEGIKLLASKISLSEDEVALGVAIDSAHREKIEWDDMSDAEKQVYIDNAVARIKRLPADWVYNVCLYSVVYFYEENGQIEEAKNSLNLAKEQMRELSEKYTDYEHYPNLKGYFTTTSSFLDVCANPNLSFNQFKDVINDYKKEARDYVNDLDYIFGE